MYRLHNHSSRSPLLCSGSLFLCVLALLTLRLCIDVVPVPNITFHTHLFRHFQMSNFKIPVKKKTLPNCKGKVKHKKASIKIHTHTQLSKLFIQAYYIVQMSQSYLQLKHSFHACCCKFNLAFLCGAGGGD